MEHRPSPVAVITGATSGIGRWIALGLSRANYHVVIVCRDAARGKAACDWITEHVPDARLDVRLADLTILNSTHALGLAVLAAYPRIALLVNNAGMFSARRRTTVEGHDAVLAVNHLSPFILADALGGALQAGAPSRIVNTGSSSSDRSRIDPDNLELKQNWGMIRAYARSKLAMMMATFARADRLRGSGVVANVVHPGTVATGLIREGGPIGVAWRVMGPFLRTEEQGADSPLHVALAPKWAAITGCYVKDRVAVRPNVRASNAALIQRVDTATRVLVEQTIPFETGDRSYLRR